MDKARVQCPVQRAAPPGVAAVDRAVPNVSTGGATNAGQLAPGHFASFKTGLHTDRLPPELAFLLDVEREFLTAAYSDEGIALDNGIDSEERERRLLQIIAALESCCRRGELLALQWRDVDLTRQTFRVRAENAKSAEARDIPISPRLRGVLDMVRHDPDGEEHLPLAYVFGDAVGGQVKDPKKAWAKCCEAAGASDLHFHDLRHESASRLLEQGWRLHHVQRMLGHADAKTTSIYLNVTSHQLGESMRRFPAAARPLPPVAHATLKSVGRVRNAAKTPDGNALVN